MKKLIVFLLILQAYNPVKAQPEKGKTLIGISTSISSIGTGSDMIGIGFTQNQISYSVEKENSKAFHINLSPKLGLFINNFNVIGLDGNIVYKTSHSEITKTDNFVYGIGVFNRIYLTSNVNPFLEVSVGAGQVNINKNSQRESGYNTKSFYYNVGAKLGYSLFINEKYFVDIMFGYDFINEKPKEEYYSQELKSINHSLGIELGISILK